MLIVSLVMEDDAVAGWHISVVIYYCYSCLLLPPYYSCSPVIQWCVCWFPHSSHHGTFLFLHHFNACGAALLYCALIEMRLLC